MDYGCVVPARFLDRPNRFVAHVLLGQETVTCHVKNTGRCRELLVPGARVYLERGRNPGRRTAWDLIAVEKDGKLINMDAQAPNRVFAEWARERYADVHPEVRYGQSRLDTISLTVKPAPCWAISRRQGASVKPAIGPKTARWGRVIFPIFRESILSLVLLDNGLQKLYTINKKGTVCEWSASFRL